MRDPAEATQEIAKKYEQETGVSVKVVTAAANTYEQTLKSEIAKTFTIYFLSLQSK